MKPYRVSFRIPAPGNGPDTVHTFQPHLSILDADELRRRLSNLEIVGLLEDVEMEGLDTDEAEPIHLVLDTVDHDGGRHRYHRS